MATEGATTDGTVVDAASASRSMSPITLARAGSGVPDSAASTALLADSLRAQLGSSAAQLSITTSEATARLLMAFNVTGPHSWDESGA